MKQSKKTKLRKEADRLWFEILIKRNPKCEVCGEKAVQVHHFIAKGRCSALRYDLDNGISLCQKCHSAIHWGDPRPIATIIEKRGKEWYQSIKKKSEQLIRSSYKTIDYYENIIRELSKL